jgi:hypothetical protein
MDSPFHTPDHEVEHAPRLLRGLLDAEDPEIRELWVAAQATDLVEARISELHLIGRCTSAVDLRDAIHCAIEEMSTELRLARNAVQIRSVNERVALISKSCDTFGSLKFRCECGIYECREGLQLTAGAYEAIRLEPTHFVVHPDHVLHALEFVVLACAGSHVVVEKFGAAARLAIATDPRDAVDEPLTRDAKELASVARCSDDSA